MYGHEPDGVRFYRFVHYLNIWKAISPQKANNIANEILSIQSLTKSHGMKAKEMI